jgi:hypothetical protein
MDFKLTKTSSLIAAILALFFTLYGTFWCRFGIRPVTINPFITAEQANFSVKDTPPIETALDLGIWNRKDLETGGCVRWDYTSFSPDPKWNAAKVFSIFTTLTGSASIVAILVMKEEKKIWGIISALSFCALVFQGLTFVFLQSYICSKIKDSLYSLIYISGSYQIAECQLGSGSGMAIFAALVWGAIGVVATYFAMAGQEKTFSTEPNNQPVREAKERQSENPSLQVLSGSKEELSENLPE